MTPGWTVFVLTLSGTGLKSFRVSATWGRAGNEWVTVDTGLAEHNVIGPGQSELATSTAEEFSKFPTEGNGTWQLTSVPVLLMAGRRWGGVELTLGGCSTTVLQRGRDGRCRGLITEVVSDGN